MRVSALFPPSDDDDDYNYPDDDGDMPYDRGGGDVGSSEAGDAVGGVGGGVGDDDEVADAPAPKWARAVLPGAIRDWLFPPTRGQKIRALARSARAGCSSSWPCRAKNKIKKINSFFLLYLRYFLYLTFLSSVPRRGFFFFCFKSSSSSSSSRSRRS